MQIGLENNISLNDNKNEIRNKQNSFLKLLLELL